MRYYSRRESAEKLGVSLQTISNYIERGIIKGRMKHNMVEVDADDFDDFVENHQKKIVEVEGALERMIAEKQRVFDEYSKSVIDYRSLMHSNRALKSLIESGVIAEIFDYATKGERHDFSERDREITHSMLRGESLSQVANDYGVTPSRIMQIVIHVVRYLRIYQGKNREKTERLEQLERRCAMQHAYIKELEAKVKAADESKDSNIEFRAWCSRVKISEQSHLSVRGIHCLLAAGKETLEDVLTIPSREKALGMQFFGRKTLTELETWFKVIEMEGRSSEKVTWGMFT